MQASTTISPKHFVAVVSPLIERRDVHGLVAAVRKHWTLAQVASLLDSNSCDARKVSALALSLMGQRCCIKALARQLHDADPIVAQMAEHAMWSIWLRSGNEEANSHVCRGTHKLEGKDLDGAIHHFTHAIGADPSFAEAYNQRAMAFYLKEQYELSLDDCRQTVELEPLHFGAWAGLGHCHASLGHIPPAVECYRRAQLINPQLACVNDLIAQLEGDGTPSPDSELD